MVKKGYKQTEVGVIPEDWGLKRIGEVFTFYSTSNFSKFSISLRPVISKNLSKCVSLSILKIYPKGLNVNSQTAPYKFV